MLLLKELFVFQCAAGNLTAYATFWWINKILYISGNVLKLLTVFIYLFFTLNIFDNVNLSKTVPELLSVPVIKAKATFAHLTRTQNTEMGELQILAFALKIADH